jgi:hypothetical protein
MVEDGGQRAASAGGDGSPAAAALLKDLRQRRVRLRSFEWTR